MKRIDFNDLFYVCAMIEYTARKTLNKRGVIVDKLGEKGIRVEVHDAPVNHCLSFEQVSDEWIERYGIENGEFDTISSCPYSIPSAQDIGKLYAYIIEELTEDGDEVQVLMDVFRSFLSDAISKFSSDMYYQNISYLTACYREGEILE